MLSNYKLYINKDNNLYNDKNLIENEKEEYDYEIEQSNDYNLNNNRNMIYSSSFLSNEKSKGDNSRNNKKLNKKTGMNTIFKINKNDKLFSFKTYSYNDFNDNNNIYNEEIINEWNSPKINFDDIIFVPKLASPNINLSEYENIVGNNNYMRNNSNKKNSFNIIKNNYSKYNNYLPENEKIKKSVILQQVLATEMKKEIENLKIEKENIQKEFNNDKGKIIKEYDLKINDLIVEKNKLYEIIQNQKSEINRINKLCDEKNLKIEQLNKIIDNLKKDNGIKIYNLKNENISNLTEENYKKINTDLQKNNKNLIKENNIKNLEENYVKTIENLYHNIKQISNDIKSLIENNYNIEEKLIIKSFDDFIAHFNNNSNISKNEKLKTINDFNNIIKLQIDSLLKYIINYINDNKINDNSKKIININHNINNLINSENGQNNLMSISKDTKNKKYFSNNLLRKIDLKKINYKTIRKSNDLKDIHNLSKRSKLILKYSNENNNKSDIININKKEKPYNYPINLKNNLLEKNSVVYKSNTSPLNKDIFLYALKNWHNTKFNLNYKKIINRILKNSEKEDENISNRTNNINLNLKVEKLSNLIKKRHNNKIIKINNKYETREKYLKNYKKLKLTLYEDNEINNSIKLFSTFNKTNENILSLSNNISKRNKLSEKNIKPFFKKSFRTNTFENQNFNYSNIPSLSNYKTINHKKNSSLNNNNYIKTNEKNKLEDCDYIKTDYKNNDNYIKIYNIFKNINNSLMNSQTIESQESFRNIDISSSNLFSKSFSLLDNKKKYIKINNNINRRKILPKLVFNKQKLKNQNNYNINRLANEVMKTSFLKNSQILSLNINNSEKNRKKNLFKRIKKNNFNIIKKMNYKREKTELKNKFISDGIN